MSGIAATAAVLSFGVAGPTPATASAQASVKQTQLAVAQSQVVSAVPSTTTPNIDGGVVYSIAQVGSWIVSGGSFTSATAPGSTTAVANTGLVAFDQSNGAIDTAFRPTLDGVVNSVIAGPLPNTVFVGGLFTLVNGVKSKGVTLLSLSTGAIVPGFTAPVLNGVVDGMRMSAGRLFLAGTFTTVNGVAHGGIATVNASSGALDPYVNVQLTGHHNYNGKGAIGPVGGRALDISPNGARAVLLGDFKDANGALHDQIVMLDLNATSTVIDPNWNTSQFTAPCSYKSFDSYVSAVAFSPDGSYFAIGDTGAGTTSLNTDGTRSLCDAASRWSTTDTGTNVKPTWVDYTGNDSFWSVIVTGSAIYLGGHARWLNNPSGPNNAAAGAVPRPGLVALDPVSGLPLAWNPGRNPRGQGAYGLLATSAGLYVGSDTNYFGDHRYERDEIGFFPLTGGYVPASTATTALPADVYEAGPTNSTTTGVGPDDLAWRSYTSAGIGAQTVVSNTGVAWSTTRGAFMVGANVYFGSTDGNFYRASFNGQSVGTPVIIDPYDDPAWDNVQTGSGQTYQGVKSGYYSEISSVTGAFYADGRLYYSQSGVAALHWRFFSPDSGTIGGTEFAVTGGSFAKVAGMFASGSTLYYASSTDGSLHAVTYSNGGTNGATPTVTTATDHVVSSPATDGRDWRAQGMFVFNPPTPPTARATASCTNLGCTFDGSASTAPSGAIASYSWNFGDSTTGSGAMTTHGYASGGSFTYTLTVTDNQGQVSTVNGTVAPSPGSTPIGFTASADASVQSGVGVTVTTPAAVAPGDSELLYVTTSNTSSGVISAPPGWTQVAAQTNLPLQAAVFEKTATGSDPGATVTAAVSSAGPITAQLLDYSNVGSAAPVSAGASDVNVTSHSTSPVAVAGAGSWVVSFWSDKSTTTTAWTLPAGVTQRDQTIGTGATRVTAVLADSDGPVVTGTYPVQTASVGSTASGRGAMISLVLAPSS